MAVQLDSRSMISSLHQMMAALRPAVLAGGGLSKPSVVSMPSPNHNDRPAGTDINTIVLHHTADGGRAQDTGRYFQNPAAEVSSHYIVGKDGTIVQSVADNQRAWHAGTSSYKGRDDVNDFSLGIEIVNWGNDRDPYTDAQYDALIKLVAWMVQTYNVPMDRITGHRDVAIPRGRKTDPSDNFDWIRVRRGVESQLKGQQAPAPAPKPEQKPAPQPAPQPAPVRDTVRISPDAHARAVAPVSSRDIQPVVAHDVQPFVPPPDRPSVVQPAVSYAPQIVPAASYPAYPTVAYGTATPLGTIGTTPSTPIPVVQPVEYAYQQPYTYQQPYVYQQPVSYAAYQQPYAYQQPVTYAAYQQPYAYQQPVTYAAYQQPYAYQQPGYGYTAPGYYSA